jgi:hypothetical protein
VVQERIQEERRVEKGQELNAYQVGDWVLWSPEAAFKSTKLAARFLGPYEVTHTHKSDITIEHVVTHEKKVVHMERLKIFVGTRKEGYDAAARDHDQHVVDVVLAYKGDPALRSGMKFLVKFIDGDERWLPYGRDIISNEQWLAFCHSHGELRPLLHTVDEWKSNVRELKRVGICNVEPGMVCFVLLRAWGAQFYEALGWPDLYQKRYVVKCEYLRWSYKSHAKIDVSCALFNSVFIWDAVDVLLYGLQLELKEDMILVDEQFARNNPAVVQGSQKKGGRKAV